MKPFSIHILAMLLLTGASSAMSDPPGVYENKAIEILNKASNNIKAHDAVYLEFEYISSHSSIDLSDDAKGILYISGEKYFIEFENIHFISDGLFAWTFLKDVNEVHISYLEDTEGILNPISLLENFEDEFSPLWIRQETYDDGELLDIIDLVPVEEHHPFQKYRLAISGKSNLVVYSIAYDMDANTYTYLLTETLFNPDIPEGFFSFNPDDHPGIEVVDLR